MTHLGGVASFSFKTVFLLIAVLSAILAPVCALGWGAILLALILAGITATWVVALSRTRHGKTVWGPLLGLGSLGLWPSADSRDSWPFTLFGRDEGLSFFMPPLIISVLVLNLRALMLSQNARWRKAAWFSLSALAPIWTGAVIKGRVFDEFVYFGIDNFYTGVLIPSLSLSGIPWIIAWRKQRVATRPFPRSGWDVWSKRLTVSALIVPLWGTIVAAIILAATPRGWGGLNHLGWMVLIFLGSMAASTLMYLAGVAIQWYRDRWHWSSAVGAVCWIGIWWYSNY